MEARSVRKPATRERSGTRPPGPATSLFPIFETGVDWLTVTCNDAATREQFDEFGYQVLSEEARLGNDIRPWSMKGFTGLNGGHIAVGKRDDTSLIRLSSRLAWSHWRRPYQLATNCSRIDFQVTISDVSHIDEFLRDREREAWTHASRFKRPPEVSFRFSNRTGSTLYLGSRQSDSFARVYNKWSESRLDHYEGCVRCEVQFQNRAAQRAAFGLAKSADEATHISGTVSSWMGIRGLSRLFAAEDGKLISCPRSRSTSSKRLAWLVKQVRPCVASLLDTCTLQEVLTALGLDELIETTHGPTGPTTDKGET